LAEADGIEPGIIYVDLDLEEVRKARARIPSLHNDQQIAFGDIEKS